MWKKKEYKRFTKQQKDLLNKACEMATSGSTIVYSTCTFSTEENWRVISEIIDNHPVKVENIGINGLKTSPGITEWNGKRYNNEVEKCMRIWPHHNDTDAFFIARLKKC